MKQRKIGIILLAFIMVFTMIPSIAFAAENDEISPLAAPTLSNISHTNLTSDSVEVTGTLNSGGATGIAIHYLAVKGITTPSETEIKSGIPRIDLSDGSFSIPVSSLDSNSSYSVYLIASSSEGDSSIVSTSFTTPPAVASDASLISVAGQPINVISGDGTKTDPRVASITVPNATTSITDADIVIPATATKTLYSEYTFTNTATSIDLSFDSNLHYAFVWVEAQDGTDFYYSVLITRTELPSVTLTSGKVDVSYAVAATDFGSIPFGDLWLVGGDLPLGLSFAADTNGNAYLAGNPQTSGTYTFTLREMKGPTSINQRSYSLTIDLRDTIVLSDGFIGNAYTAGATITVPISGVNSVQLTGSLPGGLILNSQITVDLVDQTIQATITGYPTKAGTYSFGIQLYEGAVPAGDPYTYSITIAEPDHYFLDDVNTYVKGSGLSLVHITEKELVTHNDNVFVTPTGFSAAQITKETHYKASSGSTVITLDSAYLDTLSEGEHLLTVGFDDEGNPVQDLFYVSNGAASPELPKTGDASTLTWIIMFGVAALGGLSLLVRRKKQTKTAR